LLYDQTEGPVRDITTQHRWPGTKITTAHCKDLVFNGLHQPGGVAQVVLTKITGQVTAHGKDMLGSFMWQQIILDGTRKLYIITSYHVLQDNPSLCRNETCYMQQWRQLRLDGTEHPNPWQWTLQALKEFILPLVVQDNHEIIIMMDANSSTTLDPAIDTFLQQTNLDDIMAAYLPDHPTLTNQPGVLTVTIGTGILPFGSYPKSWGGKPLECGHYFGQLQGEVACWWTQSVVS
jgi:hypothetical protein